MPELKKVRVLYLDIDGTVRHGKDEMGKFVNGPEDVVLFEEVPDLLKGYKTLGWRIIGVSNQGGIGLGHMTMDQCMQAMGATQKLSGMAFDKIVFCAHSPYDDCPCRKPKTAMIQHSREWLFQQYGEQYPLHMGLFVGDRPEDEMTAANAGIPFMWAMDWRTGSHVAELLWDQA